MHQLYRTILKQKILLEFPQKTIGRPRCDIDLLLDALFYLIHTGCQWRALPPCIIGNTHYTTVHKMIRRCIVADVFRAAYEQLLRVYRKKREPLRYSIDSTMVKNVYGRDCLGRNPVDRGRKGSRMSVAVDDLGVVFGCCLHPANIPDVSLLATILKD